MTCSARYTRLTMILSRIWKRHAGAFSKLWTLIALSLEKRTPRSPIPLTGKRHAGSTAFRW